MNFDLIEYVYECADVDTQYNMMKIDELQQFLGEYKQDLLRRRIEEELKAVKSYLYKRYGVKYLTKCKIIFDDGSDAIAYLRGHEFIDMRNSEEMVAVGDWIVEKPYRWTRNKDSFPQHSLEHNFCADRVEMLNRESELREMLN